jgi:hypothetical protein
MFYLYARFIRSTAYPGKRANRSIHGISSHIVNILFLGVCLWFSPIVFCFFLLCYVRNLIGNK